MWLPRSALIASPAARARASAHLREELGITRERAALDLDPGRPRRAGPGRGWRREHQGAVRPGGQGQEGRLLLRQPTQGDDVGGAMHALIGADEPAGTLIGQVGVAQEGPAVEEIAAEVADGPLHLALGLRPEGTARADPEAPVGGEAEELGILEQPPAARAVVLENHALHLIEEDLVGHATEGREGPLEAQHDGERRLARHEFDREYPRVAEDDEEREALAPGEVDLGEIELGLLTGWGLKPHDRLQLRAWADAGHVGFELTVAPGVARGAALVKQPDRRQRRVGRQSLLNQRLVARELRPAGRALAHRRRPAQLALELAGPDPVIDRPATDAQLPRDGRLREPGLQVVLEQHEGIPSVHRPSPQTERRQPFMKAARASGPTSTPHVCTFTRRFCAICSRR